MPLTASRPPTASRGAWAATVVAVVASTLGYVVLTGVAVVRGQLLDERLYTDALARADTYERIYTDILADPEIAASTEELIGRLGLEGLDPATVRTLTTNILRWVVPPSTLRTGSERLIGEALAYLRGDTERIDATIDLRPVLDRLEAAASAYGSAALARVEERRSDRLDAWQARTDDLVDLIDAGRVPAWVPVPADGLPRRGVERVLHEVADRTGADPETIDALLAAGNERDAVITAVAPRLAARGAEARAALERRLEDGRSFDALHELADRTSRREVAVIRELNTVRDLIGWLGPAARAVGLLLFVGGLVVVVVLHRQDARRAGLLVALSLVVAGLGALMAWSALRTGLEPPVSAAAGTRRLPVGVAGVVADVEAHLGASITAAVSRLVVLPVVAGGVLAVLLLLVPLGRRISIRSLPLAAAAAGAAAAIAWLVVPGHDPDDTCNGHVELCDRPYDEVVQAATHNAMSTPGVVKVWPEQDQSIPEQLDLGIRTLLIDTHYRTGGTTREELRRLAPDVPGEVIDQALARQAGDAGGTTREPWLCHNHCIWGGIALGDALEQVRAFLEANPREVVTLIVQDAVSPEDTASAFEQAGLAPYLHTRDVDDGWPTLGQLIDDGERLVVFAEESGGPPDWYLPAFEHMQDTPYQFPTVDDLSCEANRGPDDAPLFLMNHWLSAVAPDRRNAVVANRRDLIVERARACAAERGQLPDYVAVDFAGIGDVLDAVDVLNGVG